MATMNLPILTTAPPPLNAFMAPPSGLHPVAGLEEEYEKQRPPRRRREVVVVATGPNAPNSGL